MVCAFSNAAAFHYLMYSVVVQTGILEIESNLRVDSIHLFAGIIDSWRHLDYGVEVLGADTIITLPYKHLQSSIIVDLSTADMLSIREIQGAHMIQT